MFNIISFPLLNEKISHIYLHTPNSYNFYLLHQHRNAIIAELAKLHMLITFTSPTGSPFKFSISRISPNASLLLPLHSTQNFHNGIYIVGMCCLYIYFIGLYTFVMWLRLKSITNIIDPNQNSDNNS